jgi:hypothetical protein
MSRWAVRCSPPDPGAPVVLGLVLRVPDEHATIQAAVDAAEPGDLVLIAPGTYRESVWIDTERIVLRGLDRDTVVLDGGYELADGILVASDGVAIENLTVMRYRQNGVLISGAFAGPRRRPRSARSGYGSAGEVVYGMGDAVVDGYRVSYVTAANNGLYGIYAFAARNGIFEHSYASGHPDSGFYVGQCRPCNALLRDLVAERNSIGYYGTNASGDVWVVRSVFRNNRLGHRTEQPGRRAARPAGGHLGGREPRRGQRRPRHAGDRDGLLRRRHRCRRRHVEHGAAQPGGGPLRCRHHRAPAGRYEPLGNTIRGNVLSGNRFDLVLRLRDVRPGTNCFADNRFSTSDPVDIETLLPCGGPLRTWADGAYTPLVAPPGVDVRSIPLPPTQPSMPDAATAPARPAVGTPVFPDPDTIAVPDLR